MYIQNGLMTLHSELFIGMVDLWDFTVKVSVNVPFQRHLILLLLHYG